MSFQPPDRSDYTPTFSKTDDDEQLDVGWAIGTLSDGRPYRAELWAQDQLTCVTVFLPLAGLETASDAAVIRLLEEERVVWWLSGSKKSAGLGQLTDARGQSLLSVNFVVGADGEPARLDTVPFHPYA